MFCIFCIYSYFISVFTTYVCLMFYFVSVFLRKRLVINVFQNFTLGVSWFFYELDLAQLILLW